MSWNGIAGAANLGSNSSVTSAAINTTGADIIFLALTTYVIGDDGTTAPTDSKGNTWVPCTPRAGAVVRTRLWYSRPTSVGSGHTFSWSGGVAFPSISVLAYSGSVASPVDQENGATSESGTTLATGSITPTFTEEILVVSAGGGGVNSLSINGGFSFDAQISGDGVNGMTSGLAILVQTAAAAANPTITFANSDNIAVSIVSFKGTDSVASGGGNAVPVFMNQYRQRRD